MNRDDDIGRALRQLSAGVESNVRRPPARDIIRRAQRHPAGRLADDTKPFPWAGIAGVAAIPFVAIGAVLVGPAGAGIVGGGDEARPKPTAATSPASAPEASAPASSPDGLAAPAAPSAPTPQPTGEQAVLPLSEVTVAFTDEQVRGTECRRLTTADRFVDSGDSATDTVEATLAMLLEGPRPDEAAVGLSSPIAAGAATVSLDAAAMVVTVDVTDPAAWRDACGPDEFQWALARTVGQFQGWSWIVIQSGVPLPPPADLLAEFEGVPDGPATVESGPAGEWAGTEVAGTEVAGSEVAGIDPAGTSGSS